MIDEPARKAIKEIVDRLEAYVDFDRVEKGFPRDSYYLVTGGIVDIKNHISGLRDDIYNLQKDISDIKNLLDIKNTS